ncbi:MAG TPA: ABC transporter permease [Anoxybacillus sp.]|nr:ABC transporter permease [Anoxybacillus sp.]
MNQRGKWLAAPAFIWLLCFFLAPLFFIVFYSFFERGVYGEIVYRFTLSNYIRMADSIYVKILLDTLAISVITTVVTLLIAYPLAYYISGLPKRKQRIWLLLIMVPFWINFLIRSFAWIIILRSKGIVNSLLLEWGWIEKPLALLYNDGAVLLGMVYALLPFMVLPLYVSLEKLDRRKLEAAYDLGATPWKAFLYVTLPLMKHGIMNGSMLVFVSSLGMFVVPDILGGAKSVLLGNLIQNQFLSARDWPFGSSVSIILMVFSFILIVLYQKAVAAGQHWEGERQ